MFYLYVSQIQKLMQLLPDLDIGGGLDVATFR